MIVVDDDSRLADLLVRKLHQLGFEAETIHPEDARRRRGIRLLDWSVVETMGVESIEPGGIVLMSGARIATTPLERCPTLFKPFSEDELIFAVLAAAAEVTE